LILVLMGVCGCGKTTVGEALAQSLGWPLLDADDFHPPANVAKMAAGKALDDADRWPWLDGIAERLRVILAQGGNAVLACSALRQAYRDRIASAGNVRFVHLAGDYATIAARLASRQHRYMPASLLASQFATLEIPSDALVVDITGSVAEQVSAIRAACGLVSAAAVPMAGSQ